MDSNDRRMYEINFRCGFSGMLPHSGNSGITFVITVRKDREPSKDNRPVGTAPGTVGF